MDLPADLAPDVRDQLHDALQAYAEARYARRQAFRQGEYHRVMSGLRLRGLLLASVSWPALIAGGR